VKEKLEGKEKEPEAAKKPAAPQGPEQAVLPPYDWKSSVYVAGLFSKRLHENEVGTLSHFGHEIFAPRQGGASILENMPVSPGYLIGPGDEVVVKLWGRMEGTYRMVVDRDGKIFFPKIGSLYVAGKTFEELKSFLRGKDCLLEDGDRLEVPKKQNVVNVVGRVYNPTGVVYDPASDRLDHYLKTVGGPTESADRDHIFLVKADGSVVTRENAEGGFLSGGLMSARVEPGDSIVVPEKLIKTRFMKDFKDITQILYQIAVTAGVLIVVF